MVRIARISSVALMLCLTIAARAEEKPLGTGKLQKGLVIDVTDVKRTSDGYLKVSYQVRNPTEENVTYTINGTYFVPESYYIEEGGKYKYFIVKDDKGTPVASQVPGTISLGPDEKVEYWIKFAKPKGSAKHITLYFRQAEPIEDVPLPPGSSSPGAKSADDSQPAPAEQKTLGTGKLQKGLVIDVTGVDRTSDKSLKVAYQIRNPTDKKITYTISGVYFVPESYYVEEHGKLKYSVVKDDKGNPEASHVPGTISLGPGEKAEYWIKFAQPKKNVKHITLYFRQAEPIEDVPVSAAGE